MKTLNRLKWKVAASFSLVSLFTFSIAQAASITWGATGTFTDKSVLALAGAVSNEVYGVDFGGSGAQTVNGYSFADYAASGNMSIAGGGFGLFGSYMTAAATATLNDATFNPILTCGLYGGSGNTGTLNNLTVGQGYTVLVLLDDTRGGSAGPSPTFTVLDGVTTSPSQQFEFADGSPSVGGFIMGAFTANATTQALTVRNGGSSQYNAILLMKVPPPLVPLPVLISNTLPASASAGVGGQAAFTAAFSNSPPVSLQWQFVNGGVTNPVTAANVGVATVTNGGVVVSTLTFTNLQVTNAGSYLLKAINATNSLGVVYNSSATLTVTPLIQWLQTGTFTDNSVLALAGTPANEVYGVNFGAGPQTTASGYTFEDAWSGTAVTGNMGMVGNVSQYDGYFPLPNTTGDNALDNVLANGLYGGGDMMGTLSNLVVGQTYNVLVILNDTRTGPIAAPTQVPQTVFYGTDGVSVSPYETFVFPGATNASGGNAIGGYALGAFTARSTSQPLSVLTASLAGQFGFTAQYNAILVETSTVAPPLPPIYLNANTFPIPASSVLPLYFPAQSQFPIPTSTAPLAGEPAVVAEGSNIGFSAAFVNYFAPNNLQWQVITNGVTNNINAGVVTVTNSFGIVTSTLTLSNVQLSATGFYRLKAANVTNSSDVAYSTPYPLLVVPTITWGATGTFTDNSVLALAGTPANEIYGVDFGGSGAQTTANGYTFADNVTSGNMSIAGGTGSFGGYMTGGATTGDAALDAMLTDGFYNSGPANIGTLNNLAIGQKYTVLVLLDDTRGGSAGPSPTFTVTDGVTTSPSQQFQFANGSPSVGGYIMGTFTATATTQALTVQAGGNTQFNVILLEKFVAVSPAPPTLGTPRASGGNLILTGAGGTPNSSYTWLSTTNLSAPITWTTNSTGTLDGTGALSNSIPIGASTPARFFQLRLP